MILSILLMTKVSASAGIKGPEFTQTLASATTAHLVLGATPSEGHMQASEKSDVTRVFWSTCEDTSPAHYQSHITIEEFDRMSTKPLSDETGGFNDPEMWIHLSKKHPAAFDAIYFDMAVTKHIKDWDVRLLGSLLQCLKRGGKVYIPQVTPEESDVKFDTLFLLMVQGDKRSGGIICEKNILNNRSLKKYNLSMAHVMGYERYPDIGLEGRTAKETNTTDPFSFTQRLKTWTYSVITRG